MEDLINKVIEEYVKRALKLSKDLCKEVNFAWNI